MKIIDNHISKILRKHLEMFVRSLVKVGIEPYRRY